MYNLVRYAIPARMATTMVYDVIWQGYVYVAGHTGMINYPNECGLHKHNTFTRTHIYAYSLSSV